METFESGDRNNGLGFPDTRTVQGVLRPGLCLRSRERFQQYGLHHGFDIAKAITDARIHFNEGLGFGSDDGLTAAMNLIAFFLVWSLQTSAKGVGSQVNFPVSSKSVGGVSLSYQIPDKFTKNPFISMLSQNGYGHKYYFLCAPYLCGRVQVAEGTTTPA